MQGKERKQDMEIEKQFVDKAWANMSDMLDQEMPVVNPVSKSSSKKYLILLLLLFIGFLLGVGSMKYFQKEEVPLTEPVRSNIPVAAIEDQKTGIEKEAIISNNSQFTDQKIAIRETKNKVITKQENNLLANRDLSIQKIETIHDNVQEVRSIPALRTDLIENEYTKNKSTDVVQVTGIEPVVMVNGGGVNSSIQRTNKVIQENKIVFATDKVKAEKGKEEIKKLINTVASIDLPTSKMEAFIQKERAIDAAMILPKNSRLKIGAIAGAHLDNNGYAGWETGVLAEYQLNREFAIQSGLTFRSLKKDKTFSQASLDENFLDQDLNTPISGVNNGTADPSLEVQESRNQNGAYVGNLSYLNTPLLLSYQPVSYFKFLLGVNMAYRLNFLNTSNGLFDNISNDLFAAESTSSEKSAAIRQGIRKVDFSTIFGIGFYPCEKIGIDLRYNLGLQDFTNDDFFTNGEKHHNRSTQLSLIYFFGK